MRELAGFIHPVGRVIRGNQAERSISQTRPKRILIRSLTLRRAAQIGGTGMARLIKDIFGHEQIVRACFSPDRRTPRLGRAHDFHTFGCGDVKQHHRLARDFGKLANPAKRLDLGGTRVRLCVVFRRGFAIGQQRLRRPTDHRVILCVKTDQRAMRLGHHQRLQDFGIIQAHLVVGREHLERPMPRTYQLRQVIGQVSAGRVGNDRVIRMINQRALVRQGHVIRHHLRQPHTGMLRGKGHGGCCPAKGRRPRCCFKRVGVHQPRARQLFDVAMRIDTAGQHQFA